MFMEDKDINVTYVTGHSNQIVMSSGTSNPFMKAKGTNATYVTKLSHAHTI